MHLAQILSAIKTDRTIHFALFSGEEQGLYGSKYYVSQAKPNGYNIISAICLDMISYSGNYLGVTVGENIVFVQFIGRGNFKVSNTGGCCDAQYDGLCQ